MTNRAASHRPPSAPARADPPWEPDMGRFARQLAHRLHHDGHPWPDLAAALLTARGTAGLDTDAFAEQLGLPTALLAQLEDGTLIDPSPGERPNAVNSDRSS